MSIKENQLPTAQEVTENNLIRTVDENGVSQNMTVEQLGGLVGGGSDTFVVNVVGDSFPRHLDKTYAEIREAWQSKHIVLNESYMRANYVDYATTIFSMRIESYVENEFTAYVYTTNDGSTYYYAQGTSREEVENAILMEYGD